MAEGSGDWLGLLGLLGAASIASAGAIYNNRKQEQLTKSVNSMAVNLADSAHQREVLDLYKAGLNPILSATGNGASVPSLGTPHLDNVMSDFGSSARAAGEMMSKQRSLANTQLAQDVKYTDATQSSEINAAKAEAQARSDQARYDSELARDKQMVLDQWRKHPIVNEHGEVVSSYYDSGYLKHLRDSVEAEVKQPGTRYLQSWIDTGGKAVNNVTSSALDLKKVIRKPVKAAGWRSNWR